MAEDLVPKLENALEEPISKLRKLIGTIELKDFLDNYQMRLDLSSSKHDDYPDGYWAKWRYLWALRLMADVGGKQIGEADTAKIDQLIEEIYDSYSAGAVYDPGKNPRSEKEFFARLGLALKVREVGDLSFPEQMHMRLKERFEPFDQRFFLYRYKIQFSGIFDWVQGLLGELETNINRGIGELADIFRETEKYRAKAASGEMSDAQIIEVAMRKQWGERLQANGERMSRIHLYRLEELRGGLSEDSIRALMADLSIKPDEVSTTGTFFPHSSSPLMGKMFVQLNDDEWYFLDPSFAYRNINHTFEQLLIANSSWKTSYFENRDKKTESHVADILRSLDRKAQIESNFYLEKGQNEKDIFFLSNRKLLLVECKNYRIRDFQGRLADVRRFEGDFGRSVQYSYEQALAAKRFLMDRDTATFVDVKGAPKFAVRRSDVDEIFILCVTENPRGPLGTDLSYFLQKPDSEPYPLAMRVLDFETICKHFKGSEQLFEYLKGRESMHGAVVTGDELNFAGFFFRYGKFPDKSVTMITDDFSSFFDEAWYREKGVKVRDKASAEPFTSVLRRSGNTVTFSNAKTGENLDSFEFPKGHPAYAESLRHKMKGSDRNKPCPCGSGKKFKRCHGSF